MNMSVTSMMWRVIVVWKNCEIISWLYSGALLFLSLFPILLQKTWDLNRTLTSSDSTSLPLTRELFKYWRRKRNVRRKTGAFPGILRKLVLGKSKSLLRDPDTVSTVLFGTRCELVFRPWSPVWGSGVCSQLSRAPQAPLGWLQAFPC